MKNKQTNEPLKEGWFTFHGISIEKEEFKTYKHFIALKVYPCGFESDIRLYYKIIDNRRILLCVNEEEEQEVASLIANIELEPKVLKEVLLDVLKEYINGTRGFNGIPVYNQSSIISELEFNTLTKSIEDKLNASIKEAKQIKTPLIKLCEKLELFPQPEGSNKFQWVAQCPNGSSHHIMISTKSDEFGCGYCRKKGGVQELKDWIKAIKQKKLLNSSKKK